MCTDVDRNDKSRICEPGSVKVIARRQIEKYSRLIHTVDHVEGRLRKGFDALDAFLCHTWAVTVTGAPKVWAMQFVEDQEESPRAWYAGAVGMLHFDRSMDTGLTLRTIRIKGGVASVRAGATLLWDSDPDAEEAETRLKASAFLDALSVDQTGLQGNKARRASTGPTDNFHVLLIDHEDSFVHTLANYVRQCGATCTVMRTGFPMSMLDEMEAPDMVLMSPGPGCPKDFKASETLKHLLDRELPIFGVCLGLQSLVEYFGGELKILPSPVHGKPGTIVVNEGSFTFKGMPDQFTAARYHSIYADPEQMPDCLKVTAQTEDGIIMAIEHTELPIAAVQFHPESILTGHHHGMLMLQNCISHFTALKRSAAGETRPSKKLKKGK
jgi:anthranilate synthase